MDLLFTKYANPFPLLDGYIQTARFCEFINTFAKSNREQQRWEFYLHKVRSDISYEQFVESLQNTQDLQTMSDADIEATLQEANEILGGFHPPQEDGETA